MCDSDIVVAQAQKNLEEKHLVRNMSRLKYAVFIFELRVKRTVEFF